VFIVGVIAAGVGIYFFHPELITQAKSSVNVVEERPEIATRLEQEFPGETFTAQDRVTMNGERALSVALLNSKQAGLDAELKRAMAHNVARLAFDAHPKASELTHVFIHFSTRTSAGPLTWEENSEPIQFASEELAEKDA